ncbi:MAG: FeoB small GTPase domain-containing protein, partial [Bryobacteraceae bacterium]
NPKTGGPPACVVLCGNPNSGKTTVFNALTGLRAHVGNYPGVTVERKEGRLQGAPADFPITVLDLPGTYSLSPQSLDEQIARDVLLERLPDVPKPSLVVVVVDSSNLERNLYFASQVIELGHPTVVALNMVDVAEKNGHIIDTARLAEELGVAVIPMSASMGRGVPELRQKIVEAGRQGERRGTVKPLCDLPPAMAREVEEITKMPAAGARTAISRSEALLIVSDEKFLAGGGAHYTAEIREAAAAARRRLESGGIDWRSAAIEARYSRLAAIQQRVLTEEMVDQETFSDKVDRLVTHKFWGMVIFVSIMALMFLSIFTFAQWPMDMLNGIFKWAADVLSKAMPPGDLEALLEKGVIDGVGAVVVFLPQICLLFMFIGLLEDTGY